MAGSPPPSIGATAAAAAAAARLDAWIDPPAYANKPPILLDFAADGETPRKIVTPEGSALVVRADTDVFETRVEGAITPSPPPSRPITPTPSPAGRRRPRQRWTIVGDGAVVFRRDGATLGRFEIQATPLGAPTITLLEPPRGNLSGSLTLQVFARRPLRRRRRGGGVRQAEPAARRRRARSCRRRSWRCACRARRTEPAKRRTTGDLSEHPWAGAQVVMTLKATGVSGKRRRRARRRRSRCRSAQFHNPLARALVEQRRDSGRSIPTTRRRASPRRSTR